jgi:rotatin
LDTIVNISGHNLEEIRVRALENIISKLDNHLICEQDIIHERHLMIRLLEWFNFTPCLKKEDALRLLCRLSQVTLLPFSLYFLL